MADIMQDERCLVKAACVEFEDPAGDGPQDVADMRWHGVSAAPHSGVRRYRVCVDLWPAVRDILESSTSKQTDILIWVTAVESSAVAGDLGHDQPDGVHEYACSAMVVVLR